MPRYIGPGEWSQLQKQYEPSVLESMVERRGTDIYLKGGPEATQAPTPSPTPSPVSDLRASITQGERDTTFLQSPTAFMSKLKSALQTKAEETAPLREADIALRQRLFQPDISTKFSHLSPARQAELEGMPRARAEAEFSVLQDVRRERGARIKDIVTETGNIMQEQRQAQQQDQQRLRDNFFAGLEFGGSAFADNFTPDDIKIFEKSAGLPKDYIGGIIKGLKIKEKLETEKTEADIARKRQLTAGAEAGDLKPETSIVPEGMTDFEFAKALVKENSERIDSDLKIELRSMVDQGQLELSDSDINLLIQEKIEEEESKQEKRVEQIINWIKEKNPTFVRVNEAGNSEVYFDRVPRDLIPALRKRLKDLGIALDLGIAK